MTERHLERITIECNAKSHYFWYATTRSKTVPSTPITAGAYGGRVGALEQLKQMLARNWGIELRKRRRSWW